MRVKTSWAPRAALGLAVGASALLAAAPSASAQERRLSDLRLSGISGIPSTIQAGDAFRLRVTVTNRGTRTARSARYFVALTRGNVAKATGLRRLRTNNLSPYRAGRRSTFTTRIGIRPSSSGRYRVVICAAQSGRRARCVLGRQLTVTRRAAPAPAPRPTPPAPTPAPTLPLDQRLRNAITPSELLEHTNALADIAARNGGNRAAGTSGYDESASYVIARLSRAGYTPRVNQFDFVSFRENATPTFTSSLAGPYVAGEDFNTIEFSGSGTVTDAPIVAVDLGTTPTPDDAPASSNTSGCERADFPATFPAGAIALMKRGTCTFGTKAANAVAAGAGGVIVFNEGQPGREEALTSTLSGRVPGGEEVPVVGTSAAVGEALAAALAGGAVTASITTDTTSTETNSYNVIVDTPRGDPNKTVVVGGHLDSVDEGPGINDNGSGVAAILETAEQMAALGITPANRVRFAFWGAEESGLIGSTAYVAGLSDEAFAQIGLNLNFDMLASPNHARFVYDGDFSDSGRPVGITALAPGSADIERAFNEYFASQNLATRPSEFTGRSDYKPFQDNGIPAGGLFSGAEGIKTPLEAALFGGTAGVAYDPNYHEAGDTRENLNVAGFELMADAAAQVTLRYATASVLPAKYDPAQDGGAAAPRVARSRQSGGEWLGKHLQR